MRFIHSNKQYIERTMYPINPYMNAPAVVPLTMEAFVAPANFYPDAQELNIVKAFAAYPDANKKYIFSVGTSTSTVLPAVTGRSYAYAESGGAYTITSSGTITWTVGSTKRNVMVIDSGSSVIAAVPIGAVWVYNSISVNSISASARESLKFVHCQHLDSITNIPVDMFSGCNNLTGTLIIPSSVTSIGNSAFYNCTNLTGTPIIPSSVTSIGNSAFNNCTNLTGNLIIPNSVVSIGQQAFRNCSKLTGITLPNVHISIGSNAFRSCSSLSNTFRIPNSAILNGSLSSLFNGCYNLTVIDMTDVDMRNVTDISSMFSGCTKLTNILGIENFDLTKCTDFGNYVDGSANNGAFWGCSSLTSLDLSSWRFSTTTPVYFQGVFFGCTNLTTIGDVAGWNTEMFHKFEMCFTNTKLKSLNTTNWNTSNLRRTYRAFFNCTKLETVDTTNWNTDLITDCSEMFSGCIVLTSSFHDSKWWNRPNPIPSYVRCFYNSTNITNYTDIPVSWK